jgi:YD repeat-containing protein
VDRADLLAAHADALERVSPGDVAARAARAFVALGSGDLESARALVEEGGAVEPRLLLARARLALVNDDPRGALDVLAEYEAESSQTRFASADEDLSASIRRDALRALWLDAEGHVDLAAAIDAVERFASEHRLDAAERGAARLRDELDRPLLLAILGEFNAGKSTFINAFVGADVAPTGIVPTTATLNVLRGGAERLVRVVRADGTTREGGYDDLARLLEEAAEQGESDASPVDHVEIVLPSETLERVWIIDTPGTNAIDPEHERLAREAARRADAALWIFSAGQAGKETEAKMLGAIRESGRVVVPILNKVDRLNEEQLAEVKRSLDDELGGVGSPIPVSAKRALLARLADDEGAFHESGYESLLAALDERVFARSRELKRGACAGRLVEIVDAALATEEEELASFEARVARLDEAGELLSGGRVEMALERAVDESATHLSKDLDVAFVQAAEEVLAFVRPRRSRFASHGADPEDRAFLAEALERRLGQAADGLSVRLLPRARGVLSEAAERLGVSHEELDRRVRAAVMQPLALYVGFQRGVLRGGGLRRFFEDYLPSASLEVDDLSEALNAVRADPRTELKPALEDSLRELVASLGQERESLLDEAKIARERTAATVFGPLRALRAVLAEALS